MEQAGTARLLRQDGPALAEDQQPSPQHVPKGLESRCVKTPIWEKVLVL